MQSNINGLLAEINNIAATTSYKGINLLNGSFVNKVVQIGAYQNQTIGIGIGNTAANAIGWVANQQFTNNATTGSASLMTNLATNSVGTSSFATYGITTSVDNKFTAIANGDVQINGTNINVFGTSQTQQLDAGNWAAAINAVRPNGRCSKRQCKWPASFDKHNRRKYCCSSNSKYPKHAWN